MRTYTITVTDTDDSTQYVLRHEWNFTPEMWKFTDSATFGIIIKRVIKDIDSKLDDMKKDLNNGT